MWPHAGLFEEVTGQGRLVVGAQCAGGRGAPSGGRAGSHAAVGHKLRLATGLSRLQLELLASPSTHHACSSWSRSPGHPRP